MSTWGNLHHSATKGDLPKTSVVTKNWVAGRLPKITNDTSLSNFMSEVKKRSEADVRI